MDAITLISDLQKEWQEIGHVPFKDKEKVYEAFRGKINEIRRRYHLSENHERAQRFEANLAQMEGDENKLYRERERQARLLETRRAELRTYENNLGFLSAKSKSGNNLVQDFERKIERLKEDIAALEDKIKLIDSKID
jgi:chromosome segregation ATPase